MNVIFVDPDDPENFRRALTPKCKAIFVESLANPGGVITDLEAVAAIAHAAGVPLIVDNTLASPYLCRPIEWGADIVIHSTTKFLSDPGNAMGGIVAERKALPYFYIIEKICIEIQNNDKNDKGNQKLITDRFRPVIFSPRFSSGHNVQILILSRK